MYLKFKHPSGLGKHTSYSSQIDIILFLDDFLTRLNLLSSPNNARALESTSNDNIKRAGDKGSLCFTPQVE